jgi:hypothetical protein
MWFKKKVREADPTEAAGILLYKKQKSRTNKKQKSTP